MRCMGGADASAVHAIFRWHDSKDEHTRLHASQLVAAHRTKLLLRPFATDRYERQHAKTTATFVTVCCIHLCRALKKMLQCQDTGTLPLLSSKALLQLYCALAPQKPEKAVKMVTRTVGQLPGGELCDSSAAGLCTVDPSLHGTVLLVRDVGDVKPRVHDCVVVWLCVCNVCEGSILVVYVQTFAYAKMGRWVEEGVRQLRRTGATLDADAYTAVSQLVLAFESVLAWRCCPCMNYAGRF